MTPSRRQASQDPRSASAIAQAMGEGAPEVQPARTPADVGTREEPSSGKLVAYPGKRQPRRGHPGHPLDHPKWTEDATWRGHRESLVSFPAGFSVLELCAGAGTAALALKLLFGSDCLAGAWDIDPDGNLKKIYDLIHGEHPGVRLGSCGNIIEAEPSDFPSANAVVCGPPCQPYSSYGKRGSMDDPRSDPFHRCIDVIQELNRRSRESRGSGHATLMFAVLENTLGITQRAPGEREPPLKKFLASLRSRVGSDWSWTSVIVNSQDFGLPQSRTRVYVVGRNLAFYNRRQIPGHPDRFEQRLPARDFLDLQDTRNEKPYTEKQVTCLTAWKEKLRSHIRDPDLSGKFAFVEVSRDPTDRTAWKGQVPRVDVCECLRARGPQLHVFALGVGTDSRNTIARDLRIRERAALQGFPKGVGQLEFTETAGRRIFGNAMSVPVIGCVLAQELRAIAAAVGSHTLESHMSSDMAASALATRYVPRTPPATHRYGWDSRHSTFIRRGRKRQSGSPPPGLRSPSRSSSPPPQFDHGQPSATATEDAPPQRQWRAGPEQPSVTAETSRADGAGDHDSRDDSYPERPKKRGRHEECDLDGAPAVAARSAASASRSQPWQRSSATFSASPSHVASDVSLQQPCNSRDFQSRAQSIQDADDIGDDEESPDGPWEETMAEAVGVEAETKLVDDASDEVYPEGPWSERTERSVCGPGKPEQVATPAGHSIVGDADSFSEESPCCEM